MKCHVINNIEELKSVLANFEAQTDMPLGELLQSQGYLDETQIRHILREQKLLMKRRFGQIAVEKGWLDEYQLNVALGVKLGVPSVKINTYELCQHAVNLLPHDLVKKCRVMPLGEINGRIVVATDCPFDSEIVEKLRFNAKVPVDVVLATSQEITMLVQRYLSGVNEGQALADISSESTNELLEQDRSESEAQKKPIVQLVNNIIAQAIEYKASDINVRPGVEEVGLYYRLDGKMTHMQDISKALLSALISRIKIIARMNIAERRLPQDGHAIWWQDKERVDLRVSVIPTLRGESAVIRILDKRSGLMSLDDIGMSQKDVDVLKRTVQRQQGMVLVTGPTGAGKSTTLYSLLNQARVSNRHILTIEDPVEYEIDGIEQVQVMPKRDFGFPAALRQFLRHDPDVIMVGEIRDEETAQIANKAALTGHVVLSTLHTRDAISTVQRLYDMGIEPYLLASTLNCIVAQRLVRKICSHCRCVCSDYTGEKLDDLNLLGTTLYRGKGCYNCHDTGYSGRIGVAEVLEITSEIADLIAAKAPRREILLKAKAQGMRSLYDTGIDMVRNGVTTVEEVLAIRVD